MSLIWISKLFTCCCFVFLTREMSWTLTLNRSSSGGPPLPTFGLEGPAATSCERVSGRRNDPSWDGNRAEHSVWWEKNAWLTPNGRAKELNVCWVDSTLYLQGHRCSGVERLRSSSAKRRRSLSKAQTSTSWHHSEVSPMGTSKPCRYTKYAVKTSSSSSSSYREVFTNFGGFPFLHRTSAGCC